MNAAESLAGFSDQDDFEFLELQNVGDDPIDLTGMRFDDGIDFVFGAGTLAPGERVLVVSHLAAFETRYGVGVHPVAGVYSGNLRNSGERLRLATALDRTIHDFRYEDFWFGETDGLGYSLNIADPDGPLDSWELPGSWFSGLVIDGSPDTIDAFSGDFDDPDRDGVLNLVELALGMDRAVSDSGQFPQLELENGVPVLFYTTESDIEGLSVEPKFSGDLINWMPLADELVSVTGTLETRKVTFPRLSDPEFFRFEVTRSSP